MADEHHLLVVRTASAHPLIEQNLPARLCHFDSEASILFRTEREVVAVRSPEQTSNVDSSSARVGQKGSNR
jgi:hypothetical protein